MTRWQFVVHPWQAPTSARELSSATGLSVTWRLDAAATATFTLDGRSDEATHVVGGVSDLLIMRDGATVFRGRCKAPQRSLSARTHTIAWQAVDYRGHLNTQRIETTPPAWTSLTDQHAIAWGLIAHAQAQTGGGLGITNGASSSGVTRVRTDYQPGKPIGEAIAELGRVQGGFEWWVDPDLTFRAVTPTRGAVRPVTLDFGGALDELSDSGTVGEVGNAVIGVGAPDSTVPVLREAPGLASDPRGRLVVQHSAPTTTTQSALIESTEGALAAAMSAAREYDVRLSLGAWDGPTSCDVGDTITLSAIDGDLDVQGLARIVELGVTIDDSGVETVRMRLQEVT